MADVSLAQLMGTSTVTRLVSRIKTPMQRFQNFLGMGPGGVSRDSPGGRNFTWDIFDTTRNIAQPRAPGSGPSHVAEDPMGQSSGQALRTFEKRNIEYEKVFRTRSLGMNYGNVDQTGQRYVTKQAANLGQRANNLREFAISRMLQGQFYAQLNGQEWVVTDSATNPQGGGNMKIDFQIPAANKTDLGGILNDWSNAATNIHAEILAVNRKMEQDTGRPLRHIWINSVYLDAIMTNTTIAALAGTANTVFDTYRPTGLQSTDGIEDTGFNIVLKGIPWLTWHVYDAGLNIGGDGDANYASMIPDKKAIFMPDPDPQIAELLEGSEMVAENDGEVPREEFGQVAYTAYKTSPAVMELHSLENFLPVLYIPKAINYGDIVP